MIVERQLSLPFNRFAAFSQPPVASSHSSDILLAVISCRNHFAACCVFAADCRCGFGLDTARSSVPSIFFCRPLETIRRLRAAMISIPHDCQEAGIRNDHCRGVQIPRRASTRQSECRLSQPMSTFHRDNRARHARSSRHMHDRRRH